MEKNRTLKTYHSFLPAIFSNLSTHSFIQPSPKSLPQHHTHSYNPSHIHTLANPRPVLWRLQTDGSSVTEPHENDLGVRLWRNDEVRHRFWKARECDLEIIRWRIESCECGLGNMMHREVRKLKGRERVERRLMSNSVLNGLGTKENHLEG